MKRSRFTFLLFIYLIYLAPLLSQKDSSYYNFGDFGGIILLDSIVVSASRNSLDIQDFVYMVRNDKSFYKAFNNIRTLSYSAHNDIKMYTTKNKIKADYYSLTSQDSDGKCRTMTTLDERVSGNFFKRKRKYRYYTAKMYDRIFFTHGTVCEVEPGLDDAYQAKGMEKHIAELKKLIFRPGEKADIPFIGKKTEIFTEEMAIYYDFSITSKRFKDSIDCYVFGVKIKPQYQNKKIGKTVIKTLETYFEKSNFQVIARNYSLAYSTAFYDFNVSIEVVLKKMKGYYVPEFIKYNGAWDVPSRKPEISIFSTHFYNYH